MKIQKNFGQTVSIKNFCSLNAGIFFCVTLLAAPVKENVGLYGGQVSDIESINRSSTSEILIAVDSSQRGVFRWHSTAARWGSVTNPIDSTLTGHIAGSASEVEANPNSVGDVYAVLDTPSTSKQLYVSSNFGDLDPNVSWSAATTSTSSSIEGISTLVGHTSGIYAGTVDGTVFLNTGTATDTFSSVFTASGQEVVALGIASSTLGYVLTSDSTSGPRLYTTNWSGTDTELTALLPSFSPIQLRTGSCPISSCAIEISLLGLDPIDTTGQILFIAGSSTNGQAFKSTNGGLTWNSGWDYQCGQASSGCKAFGFTDGYPQVIRFRGTSTSGLESRHVFISRVVLDQDETAPEWAFMPKLISSIQPSGTTGPTISIQTNANDGALSIDPIDNNILYVASDLAIGQLSHSETTGFAHGTEKGNALGIDGLVINDLDYYENSSTDKNLWIVAKSGAAFALNYDPTDPTSVATRDGWVFPIFPMNDGAPPRAVAIDPTNRALALIGNGKIYRNDSADTIPDVATNWIRVFDPANASFSGAGQPLESIRVDRSYTTAIEWQSVGTSCDRVYMTVANTDTGTEGGVFYSDNGGQTWSTDTLGGGLLKMPVNALVSNSNFLWIGVGDSDGRIGETGIRSRVSLCGSSDWWKPTHSSDATFTELQTKYITAIDGVTVGGSSSYSGVAYVTSADAVYRGQLLNSSSCTTTGFDCWEFSNITPSGGVGFTAVALKPTDSDHVWVSYGNCIKESTDGGSSWANYSDSCTPDHDQIKVLVYDDLIAGTAGGAFAYTGTSTTSSSSSSESSSSEASSSETSTEECFIATAAFGSYEHKYVKELRTFRDSHLLTNRIGSEFVDLYYEYSPAVARQISSNESLKSITKLSLYPMIGIARLVDWLGWLGTLVAFIFASGILLLASNKIESRVSRIV